MSETSGLQQQQVVEKGPLSWEEARSRLRNVLQDYLDEPTTPSQSKPSHSSSSNSDVGSSQPNNNHNKKKKHCYSFLSWWIRHDLDLYVGALALSVGLLILSCFSLVASHDTDTTDTNTESSSSSSSSKLNAAAEPRIYRAQLAASVLLVVGSVMSLWMVRRRRFLCLAGSDRAKRREISRFLRHHEHAVLGRRQQQQENEENVDSKTLSETDVDSTKVLNLAGTSLTDIYPVYRRSGSKQKSSASWSRIPSLLLVSGDYIALQIGDIAPANCELAVPPAGGREIVRVAAGDTISLDSVGDAVKHLVSQLPPGKSTLPVDSDCLLTLCNGMRIFIVVDTPLYGFIRRPPAPSRSSQMSRKVAEIRKALSLAALVFLLLTTLIVFSRPDITSSDLTLIIPLPILAALGVCPVAGPCFVFFLEIVGTARILTTVHPYAKSSADGGVDGNKMFPKTRLLIRYLMATLYSRLSLWHFAQVVSDAFHRIFLIPQSRKPASRLLRVPPTSLNLLEKLGVATAFALVDDELACEPDAIPQQLLIPSGKGLKLLDLCPTYDDDESDDGSEYGSVTDRRRGKSSDSDSSEEGTQNFHSSLRRKILRTRGLKRRRPRSTTKRVDEETDDTEDTSFEVQFEDPTWWQNLPTLKCIGLASLVVEETRNGRREPKQDTSISDGTLTAARSSLVQLVCAERQSNQLKALAQCIGFSTEPNSFGERGDLSPFTERLRLQVLSTALFKERLAIDTHERSSEQSRWWGLLRPDSTSVAVKDSRSNSYELLTVGDPAIVAALCSEAWQGDISTILPLASIDKETILDTANSWKLADLDVAAFSYTTVPHPMAGRLDEEGLISPRYLLDKSAELGPSLLKDKNASPEWTVIRNQVFLGILGSLVVPRREIQNLLNILSEAGVRFVYFSPRNMRRQKELASQMGIDVAWNCAISLRALESGEDDPHRMVSNYADWDVNAKLPHGVEDVRKHLEEVDNVPLLVSLFTDVTKQTTKEMVEIFQDYSDTVIAIGLSHLPRNDGIFSTADIAVGIDVLTETLDDANSPGLEEDRVPANAVCSMELEFVSAICSHSCAFRFRGASSVSHLSSIIKQSRAALEAAIGAGVFLTDGCLAFSFYVLFSVCAPSTTVPFVPTLGSVLYLQLVLPLMGLAMAMSDAETNTMLHVPPKNDQSVTFGRREGRRLYSMLVMKAIPPALLPLLIWLIAFGELVIHFEPDLVALTCGGADSWVHVIRCDALKNYSGIARTSAGSLALAQLVLCMTVASASFVYQFVSVLEQPPWRSNHVWLGSTVITIVCTAVYVAVTVGEGTGSALPWYYYLLAATTPWLCLIWNEACKRTETRHERRAEKLRRLQFETRLGAWSPKAGVPPTSS